MGGTRARPAPRHAISVHPAGDPTRRSGPAGPETAWALRPVAGVATDLLTVDTNVDHDPQVLPARADGEQLQRLKPSTSATADPPPYTRATVSATTQAAVRMHRAFHVERQYVATNLCLCDGCVQANNLKLKFVAHIGEVATQTIRERRKLVGIDVIHVHRLLKNPILLRGNRGLGGLTPTAAGSSLAGTPRTDVRRRRPRSAIHAAPAPAPAPGRSRSLTRRSAADREPSAFVYRAAISEPPMGPSG
jgi:hypothetical protein